MLEYLQQRTSAVTAEQLAAAFDQHVNTVRGHLEFLASQGLALRERVAGPGPGRPSWHYRANPARPEPDARVRDYGALAGALASHISRRSRQPEHDAYVAGLEWGRDAARAVDLRPVGRLEARRAVLAILDDYGFAPVVNSRSTKARLTRCPLLDVARRYPNVVCEVHRGLMAGALAEFGGDADHVRLRPFAGNDACLVEIGHEPVAPH